MGFYRNSAGFNGKTTAKHLLFWRLSDRMEFDFGGPLYWT